MEYGRREPIKGISGQEQTAFTMKTIKELMAEDTSEAAQAPLMRSTPRQAAPQPVQQPVRPQPALQQPPHLQRRPQAAAPARPGLKASTAPVFEVERTAPPMPMPMPKAAALPPVSEPEAAPAPANKPKSLFRRLIGG